MPRIKSLVYLFSALYLAILGILWASPWWPSTLWWLAALFQMAPLWVLYFPAGFLLMAGLLVKGKRAITINILSFIVIFFWIMGFNLSFSMSGQGNVKARDSLRIMTCSLGPNVDLISLSGFIAETQPDIIALQDVHTKERTALKRIVDPDKWNLTFQGDLGLASRLKIKDVDVNNRRIFSRYGGLVTKYELEGAGGRINFFNVHLESPRKGLEAIIKKGLGGLSEIIRIRKLQEEESIIVSQWIKSHQRILIAGDFNMRETNPAYKKYWSMFSDAFLKTGLGFGYTYYTSWHGVRIDRLLCGDGWRVIHSEVGPDLGSDHRPVVADVEFIGKQLRVEEPQEQIPRDSAALISENFEMSLGGFEDYGATNISIDTQTRYLHGNTLKIKPKAALNDVSNTNVLDNLSLRGSPPKADDKAIPMEIASSLRSSQRPRRPDSPLAHNDTNYVYISGIKLDLWSLEDYPIVSFAYMVPKGVVVGIRVKTVYNDWIVLEGTWENELIDDGKSHEIRIDVGSLVKRVLPALKYLIEFQFYLPENKYQKDAFWIDDFKITRS